MQAAQAKKKEEALKLARPKAKRGRRPKKACDAEPMDESAPSERVEPAAAAEGPDDDDVGKVSPNKAPLKKAKQCADIDDPFDGLEKFDGPEAVKFETHLATLDKETRMRKIIDMLPAGCVDLELQRFQAHLLGKELGRAYADAELQIRAKEAAAAARPKRAVAPKDVAAVKEIPSGVGEAASAPDLGENPEVKSEASQKRALKARLGLQKLADNLISIDIEEMSMPGPAFDKLSWTALPTKLNACRIGVILYSENFYVSKNAVVPDYLLDTLQAWHC